MAFEQLMAEATAKREKKEEKKKDKTHRHMFSKSDPRSEEFGSPGHEKGFEKEQKEF